MNRKDPYNSLDPTLSSNDGWFVELCDLEQDDKARTKTAPATVVAATFRRKAEAPLLPRRTKSSGTSAKIKMKLPTFLTTDGDLLTSSLVEFGSQLYCDPSRPRGRTAAGEGEWNNWSAGSSVFLTDLQSQSVDKLPVELQPSEQERHAREQSEKPLKQTATNMMGWQPLSLHALSEHSSVTELPVKGLGHLAHGKYTMWRPNQSCAVGMSEGD